MKYSVIFTTVIALALSSQLVTAGSITDTYTAGDTLTAAKMDNIKTAVNDNDTTKQDRVTGTCVVGQSIRVINADGTVSCETDTDTNTNYEGVDFASSSSDISVGSTASTVISVAVTAPTSGFVIVNFSSTVRVNHVSGTQDNVRLWLATSLTANTFDESWRFFRVFTSEANDTYWSSLHSQNVFPVNAGTTTFYARGDSSSNTGIFRNTSMNAIFVPNRY